MATTQRPVRVPDSLGGDDSYKETHPAYALIGASRVSSSTGAVLFGSDARHQHFIQIRIKKASLTRHVSSDWIHGDREEYIEVELSEAQWATFISTLNVGEGVPCTLNHIRGEQMPYITPTETKVDEFNAEMRKDLDKTISLMEEALTEAKTRKQRETIEAAIRTMKSSVPFVATQFSEHVETKLEKAKIEAEAYMTRAFMRAGIETLGGTPMPVIERDAAPLEIEG